MKYKVCSNCKKDKLISDFCKFNSKKDGLQVWCKFCNRNYRRSKTANLYNSSVESLCGEIWKDATNYKGSYQVSNFLRVKSLARIGHIKSVNNIQIRPIGEKLLNGGLSSTGYIYFTFTKDGKKKHVFLHRLIADTFIPNHENKLEVNHINGIKTDNRIENLEWVTRSENIKHAYKIGLNKRILDDNKVKEIISLLPTQKNKQISAQYGVSDMSIKLIRRGVTWKHIQR